MNKNGNHPAFVCVPEMYQVWKNLFDDWSNSWFVMADMIEEVAAPKASEKYRIILQKVANGIRSVGNEPLPVLPNWSGEREVARVLSPDIDRRYWEASKIIESSLEEITKFTWFRKKNKVLQGVDERNITFISREPIDQSRVRPYTKEIMHTCQDKNLAQWHSNKKWIRPGHVRMSCHRLTETTDRHFHEVYWYGNLHTEYYVGRCDKCFKWYCSEPPTKEQVRIEFSDSMMRKEALKLKAAVEEKLNPKEQTFAIDNPAWYGKVWDWPGNVGSYTDEQGNVQHYFRTDEDK